MGRASRCKQVHPRPPPPSEARAEAWALCSQEGRAGGASCVGAEARGSSLLPPSAPQASPSVQQWAHMWPRLRAQGHWGQTGENWGQMRRPLQLIFRKGEREEDRKALVHCFSTMWRAGRKLGSTPGWGWTQRCVPFCSYCHSSTGMLSHNPGWALSFQSKLN